MTDIRVTDLSRTADTPMTEVMAEPPNRALVGLFDPTGDRVPLVFERDDTEDAERDTNDHWFAVDDAESYTWPEVLLVAASNEESPRQVVRLYREDDPRITVHAGLPDTTCKCPTGRCGHRRTTAVNL